jgi:hypothetical protein
MANSELSHNDINPNFAEPEEETESTEPEAAEPTDSVEPKKSTALKKSDESSDESGESKLERLERLLKAERSKIRKAQLREKLKIADEYYEAIYAVLGRLFKAGDVEKFEKFLVKQEKNGNFFTKAMNS